MADETDCTDKYYEAVFDGGHRFQLLDHPGTFRLSQAGLAIGNHLVRTLNEQDLAGRILDVGTGSGVIAMLLRAMGAGSIAATDICAAAVETARRNERGNFGDSVIDFAHCDLFPRRESGAARPFDLIVFNPPGWRTPPGFLENDTHHSLDLNAMFYGDDVVLRFLELLPERLAENGRAIVGLNSLIGIADILQRARSAHTAKNGSSILAKLLERFEFPLMFYTPEWLEARSSLLTAFERGREEYAATYVTKGETIYWFYEITEVSVTALDPSPLSELPLLTGSAVPHTNPR